MIADHYSPEHLEDAATYACVRVLPRTQQELYVRDLRAKYSADLVTYFLQDLSKWMTAIFVGLLTSYLYDKTESKSPPREVLELKRAIRKQRSELRKLKRLLESRKGSALARRRYQTYDKVLTKIEKSDPSIAKAIEDAIKQLERRGAESLRREVNSKY